jgi:hypothetical protein
MSDYRRKNAFLNGLLLILILPLIALWMLMFGNRIRIIQVDDGASSAASTRDSSFDTFLPVEMHHQATAQAEALQEFNEKHPDYIASTPWSPPDNLPTVTPVPAEAVLVALPAPQWVCGCINGYCTWTMAPVYGDYYDQRGNVYAYGIPENGTIDMRDYLVGTPAPIDEPPFGGGQCIP